MLFRQFIKVCTAHDLLEFTRHEIMLMNWNNRKADDPVIVPCNLIGFFSWYE